jgi:hypothetical protein
MTQEIDFYIEGSPDQQPSSVRTLYVDGTAGNGFRKGIDGELSHWRPNKTEERYKAGTSTEICFRYLQLNKGIDYDLVINNHLDVDGVLSVFVLTHPQVALKHMDVLKDAAGAGDFWAWAEGKALKVFQELSLFFREVKAVKMSLREAYHQCFVLILKILHEPDEVSEAETILRGQYRLIEDEKIIREELNQRIVSYHVPQKTLLGKEEKYLRTAKFNEPISERLAFWPQVRNRRDAQKMHLVSYETEIGMHYDLYLPAYCWADTKGLWQPPGLIPPIRTEEMQIMRWDNLSKLVAELNAQEQGRCHWRLFPRFDFANTVDNPRDFPVILSTVNTRSSAKGSKIPLEPVKDLFRLLED